MKSDGTTPIEMLDDIRAIQYRKGINEHQIKSFVNNSQVYEYTYGHHDIDNLVYLYTDDEEFEYGDLITMSNGDWLLDVGGLIIPIDDETLRKHFKVFEKHNAE